MFPQQSPDIGLGSTGWSHLSCPIILHWWAFKATAAIIHAGDAKCTDTSLNWMLAMLNLARGMKHEASISQDLPIATDYQQPHRRIFQWQIALPNCDRRGKRAPVGWPEVYQRYINNLRAFSAGREDATRAGEIRTWTGGAWMIHHDPRWIMHIVDTNYLIFLSRLEPFVAKEGTSPFRLCVCVFPKIPTLRAHFQHPPGCGFL